MDFNLFTALFGRIDAATTTFATEVSQRAITAATPVVTVGLTLSFILYGFLVSRGVIDHSLKDFFFRCLKIGIIVSIATSGGLYQTQIADAIQRVPDDLAAALLPNSASQVQGSTAAGLVDKAAQAGFSKANQAFENSGIFTKQGLAYVAFGALCVVATVVMTAIGGAFILLAKIALALLAALGPLFVFALLFKSLTRFFEAWCAQVVTYGLVMVMMSSVFGLMMQIFATYMSGITFDGNFNFAATVGGALILSVACGLILIQIPTIAGALAQGVGVGLWHELRIAAGIGAAAVSSALGSPNAGGGRSGGLVGAGKAVGRGIGNAVGRFRGSGRAAA